MSIEALNWVFDHSQSKGIDRTVLLVLARHCRQGGWACYPSIERIAKQAMSSPTAVRRSLRNLESIGEIRTKLRAAEDPRIPRHLKTNLYVIIPRDLPTDLPDSEGLLSTPQPKSTERPTDNARRDQPWAVANKGWKEKEGEPVRFSYQPNDCPLCADGWVELANGTVERCKCA